MEKGTWIISGQLELCFRWSVLMLSRLASVSWLKIAPCPASQVAGTVFYSLACFKFTACPSLEGPLVNVKTLLVYSFLKFVYKIAFWYDISMHNHGNLLLFMPLLPEHLPLSGSNLPLHECLPDFTSRVRVYIVKSRFCLWKKTFYCLSPITLTAPSQQFLPTLLVFSFSAFMSYSCLF